MQKTADDPWSDIEPGQTKYFKAKLKKGGVFIPVSVWVLDGCPNDQGELTEDQSLQATINGELITDTNEIEHRYPFFTPSNKSEFDYLTDVVKWAESNDDSSPFSDATQAVDFNTMNLPF
jgi:hypothetical protein